MTAHCLQFEFLTWHSRPLAISPTPSVYSLLSLKHVPAELGYGQPQSLPLGLPYRPPPHPGPPQNAASAFKWQVKAIRSRSPFQALPSMPYALGGSSAHLSDHWVLALWQVLGIVKCPKLVQHPGQGQVECRCQESS